MEEISKSESNTDSHAASDEDPPRLPVPMDIPLEPQMDALEEEEENPVSQLVNQVFNSEMLREMIIGYVVRKGNVVYPSRLKTCRLVQKSWLHTVSKLLQKRRIPLFTLHLDKNNSLQQSNTVQQNGKLLEQFVNKAVGKTSLSFKDDHIPPFAIKASEDFFKEENYADFKDILFKCGNGLVKLDLEIPKNGGTMSFLFPYSPQLLLPDLTDFTVKFADKRDDHIAGGNNLTSLHLIQFIFNASHQSLKQFNLPRTRTDNVPSGMEYLQLPVTMTTLDLSCRKAREDLKILLNNNLPYLKQLNLMMAKTAYGNGLISQILEGFVKQLEKLSIYGHGVFHDGIRTRPTYFKFPGVMEKLKQLTIRAVHLELKSNLSSLETFLPKLNSLLLKCQTVPRFRKWICNSKFENVMELRMSLVDANFDHKHESYYVNPEVEIMQCLHLAFPNLKTLEINVCGAEMTGLKYLFVEMNQLECLEIIVRRTDNWLNSDFWDSLLIGVGTTIAAALRTTPGFSEYFEIKDLSTPSIRNFRNLREFKITSRSSPPALAKVSLISDSVFHFGFLKLPKLVKLTLGGRFLASSEMKKKWRETGHAIHLLK